MLHSLNSAEIHAHIKTGLMRTIRKSERCLTRSAKFLEHINKKATLPPIKQPNIPTKRCNQCSERHRTPGSTKWQMGFNNYDAGNNNT